MSPRVVNYTRALPILSSYDYPATAYVAREQIGLSGSDWMNLAQLQALQNTYGWDIAAHGSINLATLNAADCEAEIQAIKAWLKAKGFNGGDYLAYPNGGMNTNIVLPLVQQYFTNARLSSSQTSETFPPGNQYALYSYELRSSVTPEMVAARVTAAIANHDWLILVFHNIVDSGATGGAYNADDFAAIVENLHSQGIAVNSVSQVVKLVDPSNLQMTGTTKDSKGYVTGVQGKEQFALILAGVVVSIVITALGVTILYLRSKPY